MAKKVIDKDYLEKQLKNYNEQIVDEKLMTAKHLTVPKTAIASDDDLNNYTTIGEYYSESSAISQSLTNCPSGFTTGFKLTVQNTGYSGHIIQRIEAISNGNTWERGACLNSGTWTFYNWKVCSPTGVGSSDNCTAIGSNAQAYGDSTAANGEDAHAEGCGTSAEGLCAHAEGYNTQASGDYAHAEGYYTQASGNGAHAEGFSNGDGIYITATGNGAHVEGIGTASSPITASSGAHAEGFGTTAKGSGSHAEGVSTTASNSFFGACHSEGQGTEATGNGSHAEGSSTSAEGSYSHAEGNSTSAKGSSAHAEGCYTQATGKGAHAEGYTTTAGNLYSHSGGHFNAAMTTGGSYNNTVGTAWCIGNGTSSSALSNAASLQFDGTFKTASTMTASTTADYAEYFEWADENSDNEDRVGHFVTFDDDNKIRIATSEDDYILGVVSGEPFLLGNGDCDVWNGMYIRDEFRRKVFEPAPKLIEITDDNGEVTYKESETEYEGVRPKVNPDYDPTQKYVSRKDRPEWASIGMFGVLPVIHDGTAKVNGYVTINDEGIATACEKSHENSYRVIHENSDSVVEIIFK